MSFGPLSRTCTRVSMLVCARVHVCVRTYACAGMRVCACMHTHVHVKDGTTRLHCCSSLKNPPLLLAPAVSLSLSAYQPKPMILDQPKPQPIRWLKPIRWLPKPKPIRWLPKPEPTRWIPMPKPTRWLPKPIKGLPQPIRRLPLCCCCSIPLCLCCPVLSNLPSDLLSNNWA